MRDFWNVQVLLWPRPYLLRTAFQGNQLWRNLYCSISPSLVLACLIAPHLHTIPRKSMNRQHFSHHGSSGHPSFITCSFILTNMLWEIIGRCMVILLCVHMKINFPLYKENCSSVYLVPGILPIFPMVCVAHRRSWSHGELCLAMSQMSHKAEALSPGRREVGTGVVNFLQGFELRLKTWKGVC